MLEKIYNFFGVVSKEKYDTLLKKFNLLKSDYYNLEKKYADLQDKPIKIQEDLDKMHKLLEELDQRDVKLRKGLGLDDYTKAIMKGEEYLNNQLKAKERSKKSWEVDE